LTLSFFFKKKEKAYFKFILAKGLETNCTSQASTHHHWYLATRMVTLASKSSLFEYSYSEQAGHRYGIV